MPNAFTFGTSGTGGSLFGGGTTSTGFGASATTSSGTGSLFGPSAQPKTGGSSLFGPSSGFGTTATSSAAGSTLFGGFQPKSTASTLFGGIGTTTTSAPFGSTTGGFNFSKPSTGLTGGSLFGQQQTQQQPAGQQDNAAALLLATATALSAPLVFGDERDAIMTKWNQIQAFWGTGRGYYRKDGTHIDFNPQNHFCRFKAVGYNCLPTLKDEQGFISIVCNKKESEMRAAGESNISSAIHKIMGSNTGMSVKIDSIRSLPDDKSELTIYVTEQSTTTGAVRRVPASELFRFVQQTNIQQQLKQQLSVEACVPRVAMTPEQIRLILENPPAGVDPVIWEQARRDNPDPKNLIPVPMIGFTELRNRLQHQELMAKQHQSRLDILSKGLHDIQQDQVSTQSKIEQYKRKLLEQSHRLLQVIIAQEVYRKAGYAIQPEEEHLRVQLEALFNQLSAPTQFRSRLNELLSQIRMHHHSFTPTSSSSAKLDADALSEIRLHLKKQHEGLSALVKIVSEDFADLKLIEENLSKEDLSHGVHGGIRDSYDYHGYRHQSFR